ncbi:MAG: hypothetical protein K2X81_16150 [Candidatus Obscuribacterales bacterium]|nr:hypothetical protein [Candidatus Obscuribacterales bacterium]
MVEAAEKIERSATEKHGLNDLKTDVLSLFQEGRNFQNSQNHSRQDSLPGLQLVNESAVKPGRESVPTDHSPTKKHESGSEKAESPVKFSMGSTPEREHLLQSIKNSHDMTDKQKASMVKDIAVFEGRAYRDGVGRQEVLDLYKNTSRLLDATGQHPVSQKDRTVLAEQVIRNSAHPMAVDQGQHGTCNVTTIEARMYFKYPSKAGQLVADVALDGEFKTASNHKVLMDKASLQPDSESQNNPPKPGERGYASQIFQMTAANIEWQSKRFNPNGDHVHPGTLRYVQVPPVKGDKNDTGERVRDFSKNPEGETIKDTNGEKILDPGLYAYTYERISNEISGKKDTGFVLQRDTEHDGIVNVKSEAQLGELFKSAGNKMPMIIVVHTENEPFYTDSGEKKAGGSGGWHVINVTAYNPRTKEVTMSNQWGPESDHPISLKKLYDAMVEPPKKASPAHK